MICFLFIKKANLANFADDNTIYETSKDITSLLEILNSKLEEAVNGLENNQMLTNPDKLVSNHCCSP